MTYKNINGTSYNSKTSMDVIEILEQARLNGTRIVLDYGDVKTGESWGEIHDITGTIHRSSGSIKIPILLYNKRCLGGGAILDNCIIGIKTSKGKKVLYSINS